jgi:uncharacterized protein YbbK (DUF523 family)
LILVSACLWGHATRYDGRHSQSSELARELEGRPVLALCPEVAGGLGVPRPPARFVNARPGCEGQDLLAGRARLINDQGQDVSAAFIEGARVVLERVLAQGVTRCYLKDRSPSCAYDPARRNPGGGPAIGVLSALLMEYGLDLREVRSPAQPALTSPRGGVTK